MEGPVDFVLEDSVEQDVSVLVNVVLVRGGVTVVVTVEVVSVDVVVVKVSVPLVFVELGVMIVFEVGLGGVLLGILSLHLSLIHI